MIFQDFLDDFLRIVVGETHWEFLNNFSGIFSGLLMIFKDLW